MASGHRQPLPAGWRRESRRDGEDPKSPLLAPSRGRSGAAKGTSAMKRGVSFGEASAPRSSCHRGAETKAKASLTEPKGALQPPFFTRLDHGDLLQRNEVATLGASHLIVSQAGNGTKVWDAEKGVLLFELLGPEHVRLAICTRDGIVATCAPDSPVVALSSLGSGERLGSLDIGHGLVVHRLEYSADGACLAACGKSEGKAVTRVVETSTGSLLATLVGAGNGYHRLAFAPSSGGQLTLACGGQSKVDIFRFESARPSAAPVAPLLSLTQNSHGVRDLIFSPGGDLLAISYNDCLQLWDARAWRLQRSLAGNSQCVCFSPNGRVVCDGMGVPYAVRLFDVQSGQRLATFLSHESYVEWVRFSSDGGVLVSGACDFAVHAWRLEQTELRGTLTHVPTPRAAAQRRATPETVMPWCAFSPASARAGFLASCGAGGVPCLWDAVSGESLGAFDASAPEADAEASNCIAISADASRILTTRHNHLVVWDVRARRQIAELRGHEGGVLCVAAHPTDPCVFASSDRCKVARLWREDAAGDISAVCAMCGHIREIDSLTFTPDGSQLLTASRDACTIWWDARVGAVGCGTQLRTRKYSFGWVWGVSYSEDGRYLAVSMSRTHVYSVEGDYLLYDLPQSSRCACFNAEASVLVSCSGAGVHVWSMRSGALLRTFHDSSTQVAFSPAAGSLTFVAASKAGRYAGQLGLYDLSACVLLHEEAEHVTPPSPAMLRDCLAEDEAHSEGGFPRLISLLEQHPGIALHPLDFLSPDSASLVEAAARREATPLLLAMLPELSPASSAELIVRGCAVATMPLRRDTCMPHGGDEGWWAQRMGTRRTEAIPPSLLSYAMYRRDTELTGRVLALFAAALRTDEAVSTDSTKGALQHVTDRIAVSDLCDALRDFPSTAAQLLSNVQLVKQRPAALLLGDRTHHDFAAEEQGMCVRGSTKRAPPAFWGIAPPPERDTAADEAEEADEADEQPLRGAPNARHNGVQVQPLVLPLRNLAGPPHFRQRKGGGRGEECDALGAIVRCCSSLNDRRLCGSTVASLLVEFKWRAFARAIFLRSLALEVLFTVLFTATCVGGYDVVRGESDTRTLAVLGAYAGSACLLVYSAQKECMQAWRAGSLARYLADDFWNVLDLLTLGLAAASLALLARDVLSEEGDFGGSSMAMALALPLVYCKLLFYMQGFRGSGVLVRMIIGITSGIGLFSGILLTIMVGFSFGFYVLYRAEGVGEDELHGGHLRLLHEGAAAGGGRWGGVPASSVAVFMVMLGEVSPVTEAGTRHASADAIATTLFIVFCYFVQIVLLNLLIAIMGDLYDEISETAEAHYLYSKACLVLQYQDELSAAARVDPRLFPTWLQVLAPQLEQGGGAWTGRIRTMRDDVAKVADRVVAVEGAVEKMRGELKEREEHMQTALEEIKRLVKAHGGESASPGARAGGASMLLAPQRPPPPRHSSDAQPRLRPVAPSVALATGDWNRRLDA